LSLTSGKILPWPRSSLDVLPTSLGEERRGQSLSHRHSDLPVTPLVGSWKKIKAIITTILF
jgi:hypothetical protein